MASIKAPRSSTRRGTYSSYAPRVGTKTRSYARKQSASRQNIRRAQVSRVGSHNPYKRTALRR